MMVRFMSGLILTGILMMGLVTAAAPLLTYPRRLISNAPDFPERSELYAWPTYDSPPAECEKEYNMSMADRMRMRAYGRHMKVKSLIEDDGKFKPSGPKILLVHVGKTAGSSVAEFLKRKRIPFREIHVFPVDMDMINYFEHIIVTVREPINRFISAFNFGHPKGPMYKNYAAEFYNCFPNVNSAAENIFEETKCGMQLIRPPDHMIKGYCSYMGGVELRAALGKHQGIYIVRAESVKKDLETLLSLISEAPEQQQQADIIPTVFRTDTERRRLPRNISSVGLHKLHKMLDHLGEYDLYADILHMSKNSKDMN